jgi:hypothetical protein
MQTGTAAPVFASEVGGNGAGRRSCRCKTKMVEFSQRTTLAKESPKLCENDSRLEVINTNSK